MTTQTGSEPGRRGRALNGGSASDTMTETSATSGESSQTGAYGEGDRLQQAASGLADQASRTVEAQASTMMTKAGESLEEVARAIRNAGDGLREERPEFAGFADTAAQRVDEAATFLRQHDAREVIDNAQDFARRQPAVVVAGGLALGLLVGRFLRSGTPQSSGYRRYGSYRNPDDDQRTGYGGAGYSGAGYSGAGYGGASTSYGAAGTTTGSTFGEMSDRSGYTSDVGTDTTAEMSADTTADVADTTTDTGSRRTKSRAGR